MKPFRKNLAIAIDGGGLRGLIPVVALEMVEIELGQPLHKSARLLSGSSTGSIIAAAIACGFSAADIHELYLKMGKQVFQKSWRTLPGIGLLARYQYPEEPLRKALLEVLGQHQIGDFWKQAPGIDLLVTSFDLLLNKTRFIKSWKPEYEHWPLVDALLASSAAPTVFPVFQHRYIDGGIGSFKNPCYVTAYEAQFCLGWKAEETTLISLGCGRDPVGVHAKAAAGWHVWEWVNPLIGAFFDSAEDQQVDVVDKFFPGLDFRRYQVDLAQPYDYTDPKNMPIFEKIGLEMGEMVLRDTTDAAQGIQPAMAQLPEKQASQQPATPSR